MYAISCWLRNTLVNYRPSGICFRSGREFDTFYLFTVVILNFDFDFSLIPLVAVNPIKGHVILNMEECNVGHGVMEVLYVSHVHYMCGLFRNYCRSVDPKS